MGGFNNPEVLQRALEQAKSPESMAKAAATKAAKLAEAEARKAEPSQPVSSSQVDSPDLSLILAAIQNVGQRLDSLEEAQKKISQDVPQFRRMEAPQDPARPVPEDVLKELQDGKVRQRQGFDPRFPLQNAHQGMAYSYPAFTWGQRVRLREDVEHPGSDKTWKEILDKLGYLRCPVIINPLRKQSCGTPFRPNTVCKGCGNAPTVLKLLWETKDGYWKYKVRVPGLSNRHGEGVIETELEAIA